ncbi:permease-like cell division protein FtsX [Marinisporobacter balticus]|uniref:Cell division protein FtsX n=1 Tax=Marinisporobacter balticus TaxID=2018667 RepID=A0A4R2KSJ6_9FIRM|nr:permease-like cell division protein FtsX [Marinisporobacter balticus]TCO73128.1 cell division protein FtsX [Marinisporobacter balticus]
MDMKVKTFIYMIKEGFKGLWRNRMMGMASVGSIASVLMILGIVFMIILNVNGLAETAKGQFDSIQVYLEKDLTESQMDNIGNIIKRIDGIDYVDFLSKEQALENMKKSWGENGYLLEGLEKNPLPNSYVIKLKDISDADAVVSRIKGLQGLEEIKYYKDVVEKLLNITNFIRIAGVIIIGILIFISMFVVGNTIKLTVIARSKEINIMKYVGATNWFIRWPFLVEGMLLGLLGSLIALGIVGLGYKRIFDLVTQKLYVMIAAYMIPASVVMGNLAIIFIVLGMGIGALGSIFSMRKFLKV